MIALHEAAVAQGAKDAGWPGLLVGDMAQPRGGPMITGHASHQIGLDADIWLTPMPEHLLTRQEREEMSATMVVRARPARRRSEGLDAGHLAVIKAAAQDPQVERIFVNAAIKKALCREAGATALAVEGAAVVRPRLSFPRPHQVSGRQQ